jgi:hypothetical protein
VIWTEEGRSADEIVADFPQISLADVYAALAYYHDHREQIDRDIREDEEFFEGMKVQLGPARVDQVIDQGAHGGDPVPS